MTPLRTNVHSMLSADSWNQKRHQLAQQVAQREELQRQEATRKAEAERQKQAQKAPQLVDKIFIAMATGDMDGLTEAQRLLGDRFSQEPADQVYRDVMGEALVARLDKDRPADKRRDGSVLYKKLQDFLHAASQGMQTAERLNVAFEQEDYQQMLDILTLECPSTSRERGSLAAAIAYTMQGGQWTTALWTTHGFETLKTIESQVKEMLQLRQQVDMKDQPSSLEQSPDAPSLLKAS